MEKPCSSCANSASNFFLPLFFQSMALNKWNNGNKVEKKKTRKSQMSNIIPPQRCFDKINKLIVIFYKHDGARNLIICYFVRFFNIWIVKNITDWFIKKV